MISSVMRSASVNSENAMLSTAGGACAPIEGRHETSGRHDAAASALIFDREGRDAMEKAE
jgi:hypothetical protein